MTERLGSPLGDKKQERPAPSHEVDGKVEQSAQQESPSSEPQRVVPRQGPLQSSRPQQARVQDAQPKPPSSKQKAWLLDDEDLLPRPVQASASMGPHATLGGICFAAFFHVGLPLAYLLLVAVMQVGASDEKTEAPPPLEFVEAHFVQLGEKLDPNKLPDRQVPIQETAPTDAVVVSKDADQEKEPEPPENKPEPPPKEAQEDILKRLGDRAQAFAEIAEMRKREGSPDGIEEGTAREARAGDLYLGRLYLFFRRGWSIPTFISQSERQSLVATVAVGIGEDLRVKSVRVVEESANLRFDQSVLDRIGEVIGSGDPIPPPPEEIASQYQGRTIRLRFRGKDAQ